MRCRYCGYLNSDNDQRCTKCESRLTPPAVVVGRSSAVPAAATQSQTIGESSMRAPIPPAAPRQAPLFEPERPKVIEFPRPPASQPRKPAEPAARNTRSAALGATKERTMLSTQQTLAFVAHAQAAPAARHGDAPVAAPALRVSSALLDSAFVAIGMALFLAGFRVMGGEISLANRAAMLGYGAAAATMALFYHLFWVAMGCDSAGMRGCGMRLVSFDGEEPTRRQRMLRFAGGLLGLIAGGLGLFWALVDQDGLTWHDQISETFPTERLPRRRG